MAATQTVDEHHLSDQQLREFLNGAEQEHPAVLAHIERCEICEQKLATIADSECEFASRIRLLSDELTNSELGGQSNFATVDTSLTIPQKDRFEILNEIAKGGMGVIVRAQDHVLRRVVALKIIKPGVAHNSEAISRFVQEARICGMLQHPGVVPIHDLGLLDDGKPFLAMKLIDGQTFSKMIQDKTPTNQLLEIFSQICQTLAYVHTKEVIHRDLKPLNVMVGEFGEVQVMDWGLAKVLGSDELVGPNIETADEHDSVDMAKDETTRALKGGVDKITDYLTDTPDIDSWKTQTGVIIGTPSYMPPEQALGLIEKVDKRSDVYALGAMLCEILTGLPPCGDLQKTAALTFAQKPDYKKLNQRLENSGQDQQLIGLVQQCLSVDVENRPIDAKAVNEVMVNWRTSAQNRVREIEIEFAKAETRASTEKKRRRLAMGFLVALAGLILTAVSSIAYFSNQKSKELIAQEQQRLEIRENNNQINRFLSVASEKRKSAIEANSKEPVIWENVLHEVELAKNLVNDETDRNLRTLVDNLQVEIEKQIAIAEDIETEELRLAATLDQLDEAHRAMLDNEDNNLDFLVEDSSGRKGVSLFEKAFETFGIEIESDPKKARLKFVAAPKKVQEAMTFALFEWHYSYRQYNRPGGHYGSWLRTLFEYFDTNEHRFNLRRAFLNDDPDLCLKLLRKNEKAGELEYLLTSSSLLRNQRLDERREMLRDAVAAHPDSYWLNNALAEDYSNRDPKLIETALRHYYVCAAIEPDNISSRISIGAMMIKQNQYGPAEYHYKRMAEIAPNNPLILTNFGAMLMANGKSRNALRELKKAIALDPTILQAHVNIGEANSYLKRFDEAAAAYQTAIDLDPKHPDVYVSMANIKIMQGELDEAMSTLDTLFAFEPDNAQGLTTKAEILMEREELAEAEKTMLRVVQLSPEEIGRYINLGIIQRMLKKYDDSLATLKAAEKIDPTDARIFNSLSKLYAAMGDTEKSKQAEQKHRELIKLKEYVN
ncbi:MAG: protein kinase [Mariniblastus sp.]